MKVLQNTQQAAADKLVLKAKLLIILLILMRTG